MERPLFGHGYQGSRAFLLDTAPWAAYAHNAFAQTLLDVGTLGGLLLCIPVGWTTILTFRHALRADGDGTAAAALGAMVFLLLNSITAESFAAAPAFETLLLMTLISAAAQRRFASDDRFL
jgi:O-antigen ligase